MMTTKECAALLRELDALDGREPGSLEAYTEVAGGLENLTEVRDISLYLDRLDYLHGRLADHPMYFEQLARAILGIESESSRDQPSLAVPRGAETLSRMGFAVNVILEADPSHDEVATIRAIFQEAGLDARVSVDPWAKGAGGNFPWMVVISVPVGLFLKAFVEEAGKDAYEGLRNLIAKLYDARKASHLNVGSVILEDTDTGGSATIPPQAPVELWRQLAEVGADGLPSGVYYRWDAYKGEWKEIRYN